MLAISSIACKNNSTNSEGGQTGGEETPKNYASLSLTADSRTNLIAVTNEKSENLKTGYDKIVIKFTDATSVNLTKASNNNNNNVEVSVSGGDDGISYSSDGTTTFGKTILQGLTSGQTNEYTLTFDVSGENTNAAIPVVVSLTRATAVTKDNIKSLFTNSTELRSIGDEKDRHKFVLTDGTFDDTKATFTDTDGVDYDMQISVIKNAVQSEIDNNFGKYFATATIGSVEIPTGLTLTLPLSLATKPEYDFATAYNLEFSLKQGAGNQGSWRR